MDNNERTVKLGDIENPIVSVLVFNYNYGRYLRECLDSILAQTYPNIEICFSDNCSTDDSWQIALEYRDRYPEIFSVAENRLNFGTDSNLINCAHFRMGKYHVLMCSDDIMAPDFLERAVRALEENPHCGYAMVNRSIINEAGAISEEPPFYDRSCIIPGSGQAAVYMVAAVNPSVSQIVYVTCRYRGHGTNATQQLSGRWYGTRFLDFSLCCNYDLVYIKEPLLRHRLHGENDSLQAAGSLIEIIGPFLLAHQFAEIASSYGLNKVSARLPEAKEKLSSLCLRYCTRFLLNGDEKTGQQYFYLSAALSLSIKDEPLFKVIQSYWESSNLQKKVICDRLQNETSLITRTVSYEPPPGSLDL